MILSIKWQVLMFFMAILIGGAIGFFYDLIRVFRRIVKHINIFVQVEDFLYWAISSIIAFLIALYQNNGEVRAFFILGIFLGMILYFFTISIIFIKISNEIIKFLKQVILITFKAIYIPIKTLFKLFFYPFRKIFKKFMKKAKILLYNSKIYEIIENKIKKRKNSLNEENLDKADF